MEPDTSAAAAGGWGGFRGPVPARSVGAAAGLAAAIGSAPPSGSDVDACGTTALQQVVAR
jgi:hypothetical protein